MPPIMAGPQIGDLERLIKYSSGVPGQSPEPLAQPMRPPQPASTDFGGLAEGGYEDPYGGWKGGDPMIDEAARFGIEARARARRARIDADEVEQQEREARNAKHAIDMENSRLVDATMPAPLISDASDSPFFKRGGVISNRPNVRQTVGELKQLEVARSLGAAEAAKARAGEEVKAGSEQANIAAAERLIDETAKQQLSAIQALPPDRRQFYEAAIAEKAARAKLNFRAIAAQRGGILSPAIGGYQNPLDEIGGKISDELKKAGVGRAPGARSSVGTLFTGIPGQ